MAYTNSEAVSIIEKSIILCKGIPADALTTPQLAQQLVADGNWSALAHVIDNYLGHEAATVGAAALVARMAEQGLGISLDAAQAASIAAPVVAGTATWSDLVLAAVSNADASYAATLSNRAEAAEAFTNALIAQGKASLYAGAALAGAAHSLLEGVTADTGTVEQATANLLHLVDMLSATGLDQSATDGYLSNATVFVDANGNGVKDAGEYTLTADVGGQFMLPAGAPAGDLVAIGGTDIMTGSAFMGYMSAPAGATVITPLTTLVQELVASGAAASAQAAADLVKAALGLPASVNPLSYDPLSVLADPAATANAKTEALHIQATSVEVMNIITLGSTSLAAAAGMDASHAAGLILDALGAAMAAGTPVNLADPATVAGILMQTATAYLGATPPAGWNGPIDSLADIIAASNAEAAGAHSLLQLAKAATVAQGELPPLLHTAFTGAGDLSALVTGFTGTGLDTAIHDATAGFLVPGLAVTDYPQTAPTLTHVDTLAGGNENKYLIFSYATLAAAGNEMDLNGDPISFRVESVTTGSLQKWTGTTWKIVVPGTTLISEGDQLRWKGATNAHGDALNAFTVKAWDGTAHSDAAVQVSVAVERAGNKPPTGIIVDPPSFDENNVSGAAIATLYGVDPNANDTFTFSLVAGDGDTDNAAFSIVGKSLILNGSANYEFQDSYSIRLNVTDSHGASFQAVEIIDVNNLDEVAPTITSSATALPIDENVSGGTLVYTITSDDSGDISNGVTYSLGGTDGTAFSVDPDTGEVTIVNSPNYEAQSSYSFDVIATDAAGNYSQQTVTLAINDVNEPPVITSKTGSFSLPENSTKTIYTATAVDPEGSTVTYILGGTDAAQFTINTNTGAVSFKGKMDYENPSDANKDNVYDVTIAASDGVLTSDPVAIAVTVTNVDEVPPTITSAKTATAIYENSGANQVIYTTTADDSADISAGVTFSLDTKGDYTHFSINGSSGKVTLLDDPDYETSKTYSFTVLASDGVNKATSQTVTLDINNVDEVAPSITSNGTATAIKENTGASQVIYTVKSKDTTDYVSGSTSYSLAKSGDGSAFTIDSSTGDVTLTANPDYETKPSYTFTVVATDAAGNSSSLPVSLAITNVDDTAPKFTSGTVATSIFENSGTKQDVYTAISDDTADTFTGSTSYSLKNVGDAAAFSIKSSTGVVTLTGNPDYETKSSYSFTVVATDKAGNASEQTVTLAIKNVDESATTITCGTTATSINENSGAGQTVYTATSTDSDYVSGSTSYSLQSTGDYKSFSINASTGAVTLTANPDYETKSSYTFTVIATDAANNASTGTTVSLAIKDVNEAPTGISLSPSSVTENNSVGVTVGTLLAVDPDAGDSFTYALVTGTGDTDNAKFKVTGSTLTFESTADYETQTSYSIRLQVTDAANNIYETAKTITVTNVDEVAPVFSSLTTASVDENIGTGQVVYTAAATDTDFNAPNTANSITYSLSGADAASFSINNSTGAVKLTGNPDFETKSTYNFTVTATDAAGNPASQGVTLSINDVNDPPTITSAAVVSYTGVKFTASDQDAGASLTYDTPYGTFGTVNNGIATTFTAAAQSSVMAGTLKVTDGTANVSTATYVSLGTTGADTLTVSGTDPAGLWGFAGNDTITGGTGGSKFIGGAGDDSLTGNASGVDTFYFEATAAGNGSDTIKAFTAGASKDVLAFPSSYVSAGLMDNNKASGTAMPSSGAISPFASNTNDSVNIAGKLAVYDAGNNNIGNVNTVAGIVTVLGSNDINVAANGHAVIVAGATGTGGGVAYVYYVDNDATAAVIASEVTLVGTITLTSGTISTFDGSNFSFYT